MNQDTRERHVVIIGAGPAGLTAGLELTKQGVRATVLEADNVVGGLARTLSYKGYLFDIGGHRFFTKWKEVQALWREVLGSKLLLRSRLSRIYYRGKFFSYPLQPANALFGLGPLESIRVLASYLRSRLLPYRQEENIEQWISNRFGRRLFEIFFKTYTEKVWGVPCTAISAEWAAQRIRGLSLESAIAHALMPRRRPRLRTLTDHFYYPERGPGQMWETLANSLELTGCPVRMKEPVIRVSHAGGKVTHVITAGPRGETRYDGTHFISSMPIRDLITALDPLAPEPVRRAAERLRYRNFLIVSLVIDRKDVIPDNWIYIHEPRMRVGRIQNFKNWSDAMVPDPSKTCLGMEYFVFENDELWSTSDKELIDVAKRDLVALNLAQWEEIEDGTVVRVPKAYPMYDHGWAEGVELIRSYAEAHLSNLQLVGRNGMHKYNNQDHSMVTALCAARNVLGANHDLWAINTDHSYQEEIQMGEKDEPARPALAVPRYVERFNMGAPDEAE